MLLALVGSPQKESEDEQEVGRGHRRRLGPRVDGGNGLARAHPGQNGSSPRQDHRSDPCRGTTRNRTGPRGSRTGMSPTTELKAAGETSPPAKKRRFGKRTVKLLAWGAGVLGFTLPWAAFDLVPAH